MPKAESHQSPIYACPHCDETFACTTTDDQVQISLHRALRLSRRSDRIDYIRSLITDADERPQDDDESQCRKT